MRVVGGVLKGRVLKAPKGSRVRPTSDRARESIFNILTNGKPAADLEDSIVLDVFAGTGALGLEAISRGAGTALFLDNNGLSLALVKENAVSLGVFKQCQTLKVDITRLGAPPRMLPEPADIAFLDPPYELGLAAPTLLSLSRFAWLKPGAIVVVETEVSTPFDVPFGYTLLDNRTYGAAQVSFLRIGGAE